jgi:hypothetical protein
MVADKFHHLRENPWLPAAQRLDTGELAAQLMRRRVGRDPPVHQVV